jgi:hypothetical protein
MITDTTHGPNNDPVLNQEAYMPEIGKMILLEEVSEDVGCGHVQRILIDVKWDYDIDIKLDRYKYLGRNSTN